jgi:hypothetical protein
VALLAIGVTLLDTSPLVLRVQRLEDEEQRQASEPGTGECAASIPRGSSLLSPRAN